MQVLLNWLQENFVNGLISVLIFVCCAILGVFVFLIVFRFLKLGKAKNRKRTTVDIESIVDAVEKDLTNDRVKIGAEKLTQLTTIASELFEKIPQEYQNGVKYYKILSANDFKFVKQDLKVSLDFTAYEGLRFLRATVSALQEEVYLILNNGVVKALYGFGKLINFFGKFTDAPKKPEDFLFSEVFEIIDKLSNSNKKVEKQIKEKNLIQKGLEKVGGKLLDGANTVGSGILDDYLKDFVREFAGLINLLYSDGFKDEKTQKLNQTTSVKEVV